MKNNVESLQRFMETMQVRVQQLYENVHQDSITQNNLFPSALKELGFATEELQVATEELYEQNQKFGSLLQQSTAQVHYYQNLFDRIPEACIVTTSAGKILEANLMASRLLGVSQSLLIDKLLISFVAPDLRLAFRTQLNQLLQINQPNLPRSWAAWFQPRETEPIYLALTTSTVTDPLTGQINLYWILRETAEKWETFFPQPKDNSVENGDAAALTDRPEKVFAKGDIIPLNPRVLWQVREGIIKLTTLTEDAEEILLGILRPPLPFGLGTSILPIYQAMALTPVKLVQFSIAEIKASSNLSQSLLPLFNQRFQQTELLLAIAGQRRVKNRLCYFLELLRQEIGEPTETGTRLKVRFTHSDLASACCTTRVTITRLLGELQRQRKISIDDRSHIVLSEKYWKVG